MREEVGSGGGAVAPILPILTPISHPPPYKPSKLDRVDRDGAKRGVIAGATRHEASVGGEVMGGSQEKDALSAQHDCINFEQLEDEDLEPSSMPLTDELSPSSSHSGGVHGPVG